MNLEVKRTAVYELIGNPNAKELWIVLHGYGQLVRYFSRKFNCIDDGTKLMVFPQGMHRYYLKGSAGRVGASWMTKEERLTDIQDNHHLLNVLFKSVDHEKFDKIVVFGFSQGAATAARWAFDSEVEINHLVLWGAVFPPDIDWKEAKHKTFQCHCMIGDTDEYISDVNAALQAVTNVWPLTQTYIYHGGHDINESALNLLVDQLS